MFLLSGIQSIIGGYPGGYKHMPRGTQPRYAPPEFKQPTDPRDRRSRIPALGYQEYWYPAMPAKDIDSKKPTVLRMLGKDLAFFRGEDGEVKALLDVCPHRGVYLSNGDCFFKGFLTCPYHGATFDGDGNCVAFITEGPDSRMVGQLKARAFPTITLLGLVFVWMGEGEPVDPREDIPPEMFEPNNIYRPAFYMIPCNWILTLENTLDAHNAFFTHRNSLTVLFQSGMLGGRPRTPFGYRVQIVDNHAVHYKQDGTKAPVDRYYYDEDGKIPYQMYYPGVKGVWPLHRWRRLWSWIADRRSRRQREKRTGNFQPTRNVPDRWNGTCLPGMSRTAGTNDKYRDTRWPVPVEEGLTRMVYLNVERYAEPPSLATRVVKGATWPVRNWMKNYNFRNQDVFAEMYGQYDQPEYLSSTDSVVVGMRRLFTEHARGVTPSDPEVVAQELGEVMVRENDLKTLEIAQGTYAEQIKEGMKDPV